MDTIVVPDKSPGMACNQPSENKIPVEYNNITDGTCYLFTLTKIPNKLF